MSVNPASAISKTITEISRVDDSGNHKSLIRITTQCGLPQAVEGGGKVRGARCEVVKCEVPVRGINARRWVICEAGMCDSALVLHCFIVLLAPAKSNCSLFMGV